jgi:inorganic triphosphatase YgiF
MATEIELKLALPRSAAPHLGRHRLLAPLPAVSHTLQNTYYDTPDFALQRRGVALRLRRRGKTWLLTVKSTEPAVGGLAARSEWETVAQPGVWDFGHVDDPKLRQDLEGITPRLTALFTTHFRRRAWTLSYGRSRVEVALDLGTIASGERSEALAEVELELFADSAKDVEIFLLNHNVRYHHGRVPHGPGEMPEAILLVELDETPVRLNIYGQVAERSKRTNRVGKIHERASIERVETLLGNLGE